MASKNQSTKRPAAKTPKAEVINEAIKNVTPPAAPVAAPVSADFVEPSWWKDAIRAFRLNTYNK